MATPKPREAEPGELKGISFLEVLEKLFKRPETRIDAQRILSRLSADGHAYAKYLVVSGPASDQQTAQEMGITPERLAAAVVELEKALATLKSGNIGKSEKIGK